MPAPAATAAPLRIAALLGVLLWAVPGAFAHFAPAVEEDGVAFELQARSTFRWLAMMRLYDIALHRAPGRELDAIRTDRPMRLELYYHRGFTAEQIVTAGDTILRRNTNDADREALAARLQTLNAAYRDVAAGDRYTLTYVPGQGTTLRLNGQPLVSIPGSDFAAAYFRVWLGDRPISAELRDQLLGRTG